MLADKKKNRNKSSFLFFSLFMFQGIRFSRQHLPFIELRRIEPVRKLIKESSQWIGSFFFFCIWFHIKKDLSYIPIRLLNWLLKEGCVSVVVCNGIELSILLKKSPFLILINLSLVSIIHIFALIISHAQYTVKTSGIWKSKLQEFLILDWNGRKRNYHSLI